jgi:hypothetical protein
MPNDDLDDPVADEDEEVKKPSVARGGGGRGGKPGQAVAGPGLAPLYVSDTGLDKYSMKKGTRVTDIVDFKILKKADVMKDMEEMKDQCDFWSLKEQMEVSRRDARALDVPADSNFEHRSTVIRDTVS